MMEKERERREARQGEEAEGRRLLTGINEVGRA